MTTHEGVTIQDGDQLWLPIVAHVLSGVTSFTTAYSSNSVSSSSVGTDTHKNKPNNYPDM